MSRYRELFGIVRDLQPRHVIEIGTWGGKRAAEFMAVSDCYYTGFDLFDQATAETDRTEMNIKEHFDLQTVAKQLETAGLSKFCLIRGNTRETLPKFFEDYEPFDFAFIDGGHSVETIKSDFELIYKHIDPGGTIILDDYYIPETEGFGCNFIKGEVLSGDQIGPTMMHIMRVVK
jgi:predicted O-methyltransferase YrrM